MKRICASMLAVWLLAAGAVYAQPALPTENHYRVYSTGRIGGLGGYTTVVTDQFGSFTTAYFNDFGFANPAEKIHDGVTYSIVDPVAHQMWWSIRFPPTQPSREIIAIDQFGTKKITLRRALYLVNPALKIRRCRFPLCRYATITCGLALEAVLQSGAEILQQHKLPDY